MKKVLQLILGLLVFGFAALYISPYSYFIPGLAKIYGTGHSTAFLEDYTVFDNLTVKAAEKPDPWPKHVLYNSLSTSEEIKAVHEKYKSVAFVVIKNDSLLHEEYFSGYGPDSKSNSFSMSKSMVTSMLGKAIQEGYIRNLDQKVSDFLPQYNQGEAAKLTVGDLASMSSGLDWKEEYYTPFNITTESYFTDDLEGLIQTRDIISPPGKEFIYLSGNTQLLGVVLKKAIGMPISQYFAERFWQPMGAVEDALWQVDSAENKMEKAYCCFASNAKDFARLGKLYKDHGQWNGEHILDSTFVALSTTPRFEASPEYGYGWWLTSYQGIKGFAMRGHLGQYVIVFPEANLIAVRLGHLKGPKVNDYPSETFYTVIKEAFELAQNAEKS